jgi:hypothetical protein
MKRLLLATVVVCLATSAIARDENALVDCLVGQMAASLNKQSRGKPINARAAVSIAWRFADKQCPGRLSEGASDYVHHTMLGIAKTWFEDAD